MDRPEDEITDISAGAPWSSPLFPGISQAAIYFDLASFGTLSPSGATRQTPIRCRKRPSRRACLGLLQVRRRDVPKATIEWECPDCGTSGQIIGWEDGAADLRRLRNLDKSKGSQEITISVVEHAALREFARGDANWAATLYGPSLMGEGVLITVPAQNRVDFARALMVAAHQIPGSTQGKRLRNVATALDARTAKLSAEALRESTGSEFARAAQSADALGELLDLDAAIEAVIEDFDPISMSERSASHVVPNRRRRRRAKSAATHTIKITLRDVKPPVWRRLMVPSDIELPHLHAVIQAAMGWCDCHLHAFVAGREHFSPHRDDIDPIGEDSHGITLRDLIPKKGGRLIYEYDFGDGWRHDILVEQVTKESFKAAVCVKGKRACPPEDCGGPWGYAHLLEVLRDPKHEEHEDLADWCGAEFDPERFEIDEINAALKRVRL